jgi:hypothetical protein
MPRREERNTVGLIEKKVDEIAAASGTITPSSGARRQIPNRHCRQNRHATYHKLKRVMSDRRQDFDRADPGSAIIAV